MQYKNRPLGLSCTVPYTITATYSAWSGVTTHVLFHWTRQAHGAYEIDRAIYWFTFVNRILQKFNRRKFHRITYTIRSNLTGEIVNQSENWRNNKPHKII